MGIRYPAAAVLLMCASASLAAFLFADPPQGQAALDLEQAVGTVQSVDESGRVITLRNAKGVWKLSLDPSTTVFVGGRRAKLSDLAVGQAVRSTYEVNSRRPVAQWIEPIED
jgi:hypothetical protein